MNSIQAARMEEVSSECSNSLRTRSERPEEVLETRPLDDTPIKMVESENTKIFDRYIILMLRLIFVTSKRTPA